MTEGSWRTLCSHTHRNLLFLLFFFFFRFVCTAVYFGLFIPSSLPIPFFSSLLSLLIVYFFFIRLEARSSIGSISHSKEAACSWSDWPELSNPGKTSMLLTH